MEQIAVTTTNPFSYPNNRPIYGPPYPPYSSFFDYNEAGTTPTESLLLPSNDAQFAIPPGDNSWSHSDAWGPDNTTGSAFDTNLPPSSSLMHHTPMPFVWGMSNFEPMVATAWPMAAAEPASLPTPGSPSAGNSRQQSTTGWSTSSSGSRRPSIARYPSGTTTTVEKSPSSITADPYQQREQARFASRVNKRRKSGLEPQQQKLQGGGRGKRPPVASASAAAATAGPLAPSIRPTPSPEGNNTSFVHEDSHQHHQQHHPDGLQTDPSPLQQQELPPSRQGHDEYAMGHPPQAPFPLPPSQPPPPPPPQQQQHHPLAPSQQASQALRERNRAAANKCRRKSKAVVADLEATERDLSDEHESLSQTARALREEVLALKNALLVHGHCDDEVIQQYLANSARLVGSGAESRTHSSSFM